MRHQRCLEAFKRVRDPLATVWPALTEAMRLLADTPRGSDALCPPMSALTWRSILAKLSIVRRVKIGEFRDRASELIRRAATGETIVILNRDRAVAKIVPISAKTARAAGLVGSLAGTADIRGDIETPIALPEVWFRPPA